MKNALNLIWIDLEMTGLSPEKDRIIEIATLVTDKDLNILGEGPSMRSVNRKRCSMIWTSGILGKDGKSGLIARVQNSTITEVEAEKTIEFLSEFLAPYESPMCGNWICQDRRFLARYMPNLEAFFHYRNLDVSTLKELARRWNPKACEGLAKSGQHLALADIHESVDELKHYRTHFLKLDS